MRNQNLRNKWTEENISYLKFEYLQGSPLKQIAARLNRSVSAINKVLARHNLRTHSRMERPPSLLRPSAMEIKKKKLEGMRLRVEKPTSSAFYNTEFRRWVLFEQVLCWMESQKIKVIKNDYEGYYEIDGFPKRKYQVLILANSLREQKQLPIFFVDGITYN